MTQRTALFSLLAALLLLVQSQGLWHQHDLDAHTNSDICEFCVGFAALDHGLTMVAQFALPITGAALVAPVSSINSAIPALIIAYSSRAPPAHIVS